MLAYARLWLDSRLQPPNPLAAYVWAVLSTDPEGSKLAGEVESGLSPEQIHAGQEAASHLAAIKEQRGLRPEDLEQLEARLALLATPAAGSGGKARSKAVLNWKVADIRQLCLTLYIPTQKAVFSQAGSNPQKTILPLREAFTPKFITLLQNYHQDAILEKRPIQPLEHTLLRGISSQRANREAVADFNHHLRRILGWDSSVSAFVWKGNRKQGYQLRALFNLKVEY